MFWLCNCNKFFFIFFTLKVYVRRWQKKPTHKHYTSTLNLSPKVKHKQPFKNAAVGGLHPSPCTPHPAPCTLHPSPCTPRPAPCTPHPAPLFFTLHPSPADSNQESHYLCEVCQRYPTIGLVRVDLARPRSTTNRGRTFPQQPSNPVL
jgi:hypothetical protein